MPPKKSKETKPILIIVESPAKCKKIEEYLGPNYKCVASYGHLRTIPSLKNIDIENNFTPTYEIINEEMKKKQIEVLRKEIKNAKEVILSSDKDREGEMISYSLIELFDLPLDTKRITFNEITKSAITQAIQNPKTVDMNLVYAQQARQILDVLVGFKVSPILWKFITTAKGKKNSLSAGRCQTPALRLVYENQKEIDESTERMVYNIKGYFTNSNLPFELFPQGQFETEEEATHFLQESVSFSHIYTCGSPVKVYRSPPQPFTTSRLQQVASNELRYSPKDTMRICQKLYESGYITYMRTDSNRYSEEFIESVCGYIHKHYSDDYFNQEMREKEKYGLNENDGLNENKQCQEAHEAIRPTNILLSKLPDDFDNREKKMYELIWKTTLESCMVNASYHSITANITAPFNMKYKYTSEIIDFPGWKMVENKFSNDRNEFQYLQTIQSNVPILYKRIETNTTFKGSKLHYTEARLVQLLEEKGIGRPSTFSSLVDKIQERGYVKKEDIKGREILCKDYGLEDGKIFEIETKKVVGNEKSKLVIQPLGKIVMEFLDKHFYSLFNYDYTSSMELFLDKVANGEIKGYEICASCNMEIDKSIYLLKDETKIEYSIDENNTYIVGKNGPVIKCTEEFDGKTSVAFKPIKKNITIEDIKRENYEIEDIIEQPKDEDKPYYLGKYQAEDLILRKGPYGLYVKWGKKTHNLKELEIENEPMESIKYEKVVEILDKASNIIREISPILSIRKGPRGDYIFYKTAKMKKPIFYDIKNFVVETGEDYKTCNLDVLKSWIEKTHKMK